MSIRLDLPETTGLETDTGAPVAEPVARRTRLVQPDRGGARANGAALFAILVALAGVIGLVYLVQTSAVAGLGLELTRLQREIDQASTRNEELSFQLGYYESLPVVRQVATGQLGMQPAESTTYLTVNWPAAGELSVPEPAAPAHRSRLGRALDALLGRGDARSDGTGGGQ